MRTEPLAELTGVGVGPGAPGLLTIEGARVIAGADLVFAPAARSDAPSLAAEIAAGTGLDRSRIRELSFAMTRDRDELRAAWAAAAEPVVRALEEGKRCAFITLGDPSVYSTWIYLRRAVEEQRPGTVCAAVPGIMAAAAAAARLGVPLVEGNERMVLLPLPDPVDGLDAYLPLAERLVVYKIGARLPLLADWVAARGLGGDAGLVVGVGLDREKAGKLLALAAEAEGYLSVAIIGTGSSRPLGGRSRP